ncbi:MAG: redox-sensitive bicupin YhaK (pirin superfamily) [Candidatus Krumholzibacteriia bacterium]|jgi:redox-sensitive bicupin YhaK (pirin superfamily)
MITYRPASERGHANHGWLNAKHSFSFASYVDRDHVTFRKLRVLNEDRIAAGMGFGEHGHDNMEIITYIIEGALAHKDSTGHVATLGAGDVQVMTAGSGVTHSEFNASKTDELHLLQIWIFPEEQGTEPGHAEAHFSADQKRNRLQAIASVDGRDGSLKFGADAAIYASELAAGQEIEHRIDEGRHCWLQVISGELEVSGQRLFAGDGAGISDEQSLVLRAHSDSEFLAFDLA